ncbi:hypothetical protein [Candidatus Protochlamydia sp. R18]|uniref:hypothetical protein n=1 Tax=Candidatus Protochlamydia sp. R18 TaxID=1353977 RepID=UPI0005A69DF6|nr:hypothetical protein [Candidatus Protochlamydia sp. R18]
MRISPISRETIFEKERTKAGLASASARGRKGEAPFKMTNAKLRLEMAVMSEQVFPSLSGNDKLQKVSLFDA